MSEILLSIKPKYANQILNGTKKFEFRRRLPQEKIKKIVIYSTSPEMKVVGDVEVLGVIELKKTPLWEKTKQNAGISRAEYRDYFQNCNIAYAYELGKVTKFHPTKKLSDYNIQVPPQSFVYIEK